MAAECSFCGFESKVVYHLLEAVATHGIKFFGNSALNIGSRAVSTSEQLRWIASTILRHCRVLSDSRQPQLRLTAFRRAQNIERNRQRPSWHLRHRRCAREHKDGTERSIREGWGTTLATTLRNSSGNLDPKREPLWRVVRYFRTSVMLWDGTQWHVNRYCQIAARTQGNSKLSQQLGIDASALIFRGQRRLRRWSHIRRLSPRYPLLEGQGGSDRTTLKEAPIGANRSWQD